MSFNTFGHMFRVTTFGESHGVAIGCVVDGCPPLLPLDVADIQADLDRRKPGQSRFTTQRQEADIVKILSGVMPHPETGVQVTTGTPIALLIENTDQRSKDYSDIKDKFRPGHADFTYEAKYGLRDYRGGGRSSARETATRVAAGAIARKIDGVRKSGSSIGAVIEVVAEGIPAGLGAPIYAKLDGDIAAALMSINAVKGVEIGDGFGAAELSGEDNADEMRMTNHGASFLSNHAGGVLGGISTGQPVVARFAVKPTSSILAPRKTIDRAGADTDILTKGRHDPCVGIRAVPVGEAMVACVMADHFLRHRGQVG
jgi:chorismate synthase